MRLILIISFVTSALAFQSQADSIKSVYKNVFGDDYEDWANANEYILTGPQVSIRNGDSHFCSGSIISTNLVITSAYCVHNATLDTLKLKSSSVYLNPDNGDMHNVTRSVPHPLFNAATMDYDVAILQVEPEFVYSAFSLPIQLADEGEELKTGTMVRVSGWGRTSADDDSFPDILNYVEIPIFDWNKCNENYKGAITKRMICAGYSDGAKGPCKGDEGGPLLANLKLYGIISWGKGCALPNYPWLYTKISAVRPFIDQLLNEVKPENATVVSL